VYRNSKGTSVAPWSGADGSGNGIVGKEDYDLWKRNFGATANQVQQQVSPALVGDYNRDGQVDAADYTVYRNSVGTSVAPWSGADGSGNGIVGKEDYDL